MTTRSLGTTVDWLSALQTEPGRALLDELASNPLTPSDELRLIPKLRARFDADLVAAAITQTKLRRRARAKFSRADEMFLTARGLEQASTERMAAHHATRFTAFDAMFDLCSGIGGDLIKLADGRRVTAVDLDPLHSRIGAFNAGVYGHASNVTPMVSDVADVDLSSANAAFVDPARRSDDKRFRVGQSDPSLEWCFALAQRGIATGIKAAPGLPHDVVLAQWEIEFVSEQRELKECVLWSPHLATADRRATLLPSGETLVNRVGVTVPVNAPGKYLLDPDPAVTRAGLVEELGESIGDCWKIDDRIGFLSSDSPFATPFGRGLAIEASFPWSLARLKEALRSLDIGVVDIRKRGSAVDVDEIHRRLKPTGTRAATVVLTRVEDAPWAMVCT